MKNIQKVTMQFFLALALLAAPLVAFQLQGTEALAQSSYFSSRGCTSCHGAPVATSCAGCHHHSGSVTATTNKTTSYAPGETVTITLASSGARTGWIGVRLYDQTGVEIARSTGNQSGMGGSATFPAVLSAPAPATAGTYAWKIAYFGNNDGTGTGDVHSETAVNVSITVASVTPPADTTVPVVSFTLPATATSLTVPVSSLSATDNVAVTGYLVNKSATIPAATAAGWTASAPTSVTAVAGSNTFYAWAMAMARTGDGERAVQLLRMLNPIEHARDEEAVQRYVVEPYVVAADVYRLPGRIGRGGWSWYTGSAAWMYRAWIEEVLGLQIRNGQMRITPVIPGSWPGFTLNYRHGAAIYAIQVENPHGCESGVAWVEMDGQRVNSGLIALERAFVKHQVIVMMGTPEKATN